MRKRHVRREEWFRLAGAATILLIWLVLGGSIQPGFQFPWDRLLIIIFWVTVLVYASLIRPVRTGLSHWKMSWSKLILVGIGILILIVHWLSSTQITAWGTTVFFFSIFLNLDRSFAARFENESAISKITGSRKNVRKFPSKIFRLAIHFLLALALGGLMTGLTQLESNFSDEEFFVASQALALAVYFLGLRGVWFFLMELFSRNGLSSLEGEVNNGDAKRQVTINFGFLPIILACVPISIVLSMYTIISYQRSFYPIKAPSYPGISSENPFLCGQSPAESQTYQGQETYKRLLALVEANPKKGSPEYGMLALGTSDSRWTQNFHNSLLDEARQHLFTGPTGSVKSVQENAAKRVYFYSRVNNTFPDLFSPAEDEIVHEWFFSINRRALSVEPVDLLYALAFHKWPEGPYENQESGAGLLALLETTGLADPALSLRNRAYLDANQRGWEVRFRVTDDAAVYQPIWLDNAYFQSLYTGITPQINIQHSFEWLLLQALPDGTPLKYNHTESAYLDGIAYLGYELTGNNQFLWLAGRTVEYLESRGMYTSAQPGFEKGLDPVGHSPSQGSCLLYGDSGLPNQVGPLAPDKIVFRDGWSTDSMYLLLDLRFSGWHRYKATNAIALVYQNGPLVEEKLDGDIFTWLPTGRSLFRDKRVPRENLNGLVVARTSLSAVLYTLTGFLGPWSQDPPYYANIEQFSTGPFVDTSTSVISGWHGWTHQRTVSLYHGGPLVVIDKATGPAASPAALIWNIPEENSQIHGQRILIRSSANAAEMVLIPITGTIHTKDNNPGLQVQVKNTGKITLASIFLTGDWVGSQVKVEGKVIVVTGPGLIEIPIP